MSRARWITAVACAAAIAGGLALGPRPAAAEPDRKVRGPVIVTPGNKDGKAGYWVDYRVYTLRDYTAEFNDLLSYNGRAIALSGVPTTASTSGSAYDNKWVEFGRDIDFGALEEALGNPSYNGVYGNKKAWIQDYAVDTGSGFKVYDRGCTASSLLEASRLAKLYLLLERGVVPPQSSMAGYHVAYYADQSYTTQLTAAAVLARLREVFAMAIDTYSPIVLDLNHDGRIGVTGKSTAAVRKPKNAYVPAGSVVFDLRGFGEKRRYEWLSGDGDAFLVHDRDGRVSLAAAESREVDGRVLFGNAVGYDNGFQKLALYTGGVLAASREAAPLPERVYKRTAATGADLEHIKVWIDSNRDGRPQPAELQALDSLGISEIGLKPRFVRNKDGELLIQSYFIQNGKRYLSEDVWFAEEPAQPAQNRRR